MESHGDPCLFHPLGGVDVNLSRLGVLVTHELLQQVGVQVVDVGVREAKPE